MFIIKNRQGHLFSGWSLFLMPEWDENKFAAKAVIFYDGNEAEAEAKKVGGEVVQLMEAIEVH